jgi:pyruvate dehydrogenase (quinone)/pyruvate oxidase
VNLDRVFADVAAYSERVMGPTHVKNVTDLACRTALSYHAVAHINIPKDIQETGSDERSMRNVKNHTSSILGAGARLPGETELKRAAGVLNSGKRIVILAGQGALHATDELEAVAERLGAPIAKALLGKAAVPDDSPYTTGGVGLLGTKASQEALEDCDTLLLVGTSFPYIEFYPDPEEVRCVQIEINPAMIGLRFPVEVGLVGDSRVALQALLPLLDRNPHRRFLEKAQKETAKWWKLMEERGTRQDKPMKPQVVAWELGKRLSDTAIVSCDSGTIATWFARHIPVRRGQKHSLSGTLASMANALPYAIAAQIAFPERQSVAFIGDGGFSMLMGEFATAVKYKLPIKVVVVNNNTLAMIKWEQMVVDGNPEFACELSPIDYAAFARACGGKGYRIEDPGMCGEILEEALAEPGPVILDAIVDPFEPPMPPKVNIKQATKLAEALAKGTPNRLKTALTIASDEVREVI